MSTAVSNNNSRLDFIYRPLGLDSETSPGFWFIIVGSLLSIAAVYVSYGNMAVGAFVIVFMGMLLFSFYRLEYSLMILIACVLLLDQYRIPGFEPITYQVDYFKNLKEMSYIPYFVEGVVNPIECHLILLAGILFFVSSIKRDFTFRRIPAWGACLLFFTWLVVAFNYGMSQNGDFLIALWEVRALFYLAIVYILIPQIIRNEKHLRILMWIVIGAIAFKAFQAIMRFGILKFSTGGLATLTNHEDPVFMVTLFMLLAGFWLYNVKDTQKTALLLLLVPMFIAFILGQRRAAIAALLVSLVILFILISGRQKWQLLKFALPLLVVAVAYGAIFWNMNYSFGLPVKIVKTAIITPEKEENPDEYYSNLYRDYENYNLAYTVTQNPVRGTGFGVMYEMPMQLDRISFPLRDYIPHNQILWVIVKTGAIGFFLFLLFFNLFAMKAVSLWKRLEDPYLKSVCMVVILAIIGQLVVSFFDLQLTYYRNMIYLGLLMGLIPVIEVLHSDSQKKRSQETSGDLK